MILVVERDLTYMKISLMHALAPRYFIVFHFIFSFSPQNNEVVKDKEFSEF